MKDSGPDLPEPNTAGVIPLRVLVVDDDPFVRTVTADALSFAGATVRMCASGMEAAAVVAEFRPSLVLLDLRMQGLDGRATWKMLREKVTPAPRLIFLTGE